MHGVGRLRFIAVAASAALIASCGNPVDSALPTHEVTRAPTSPSASIAVTTVPAISPTLAPTPAIPALTGRIVFTRAGGAYGDETTFVANIDGSGELQIGELGKSGGPWAMRDGSLLVVTTVDDSGRLIASMSQLDGSDARLVPQPAGLQFGSGPFTPDGRRFVVEAFTAPGFDADHTYVVDRDGTSIDVLVDEHFITGDVSPGGEQVLLFKGPKPAAGVRPPPGNLWLVDIDGSNLHKLTPDSIPVQCCFNFHWSPDGSRIIFASPDGGLWTIAPDGAGQTEVFRDTEGRWAITPTWSPDGSMIMFGLDPTEDPFRHPPNGLYVIRADGTGLTLVLGGQDFKREPIWLPA